MIEMLHTDCMDYMAGLPDNAFELGIIDPPYGLDKKLKRKGGNFGNKEGSTAIDKYYVKNWDVVPNQEYFNELFRVSKNQIIWGGNHFDLPASRGWIVWDKHNVMPSMSFGELAWTSFDKTLKKLDYPYTNFVEGTGAHITRIHPTQKPVALYKWLLSRYAKPGDRILDTHGGSGSICIACHDLGYDLTWMELDTDYYKAAVARYKNHAAQALLFDPAELTKATETPELFGANDK